MVQYMNRRIALVAVDAIASVELKGLGGDLLIYLAGRKKPIKTYAIYDERKGEWIYCAPAVMEGTQLDLICRVQEAIAGQDEAQRADDWPHHRNREDIARKAAPRPVGGGRKVSVGRKPRAGSETVSGFAGRLVVPCAADRSSGRVVVRWRSIPARYRRCASAVSARQRAERRVCSNDAAVQRQAGLPVGVAR